MASVVHRYTGRMFLAAGQQHWFGFNYTSGDPQPRSWNRWSVGHTGFGAAFTYVDILQELAAWDINATPRTGWNMLVRAQNGDADFIMSAVSIDQ
ncbi:hypothetical protein [Streptomyces sp. NPDC050485]|uniref:hypothetical protein n=1 Tax=Streptomyces sp. NPDC050485 TaxID=3365617 RepID=UPI00378943F6